MEKDSRVWDDDAPDPESVEVCRYYCDESKPHVWILVDWEEHKATPFNTLEDAMQYVRAGVKDESILYPALLEIHAENIVVIE
jgi:hypothetical protein